MSEQIGMKAVDLETIIENTQANLALFDRNFNFILVNSAYARGSGYSKDQLIGRNHFDLFPNLENQEIFERVRDTGEPYTATEKPFVYKNQPKRGTTYWNWILAPIKTESGRVSRLLLSLLDVTPQVRARQEVEKLAKEARLRAEELDAIISSMADGLVIYGLNGEMVRMNRVAEDMLGFSMKERQLPQAEQLKLVKVGTVDGKLLRSEETPAMRALRGETVRGFVMLLHRADGKTFWVTTSTAPIRGLSGTIIGAVATFSDITAMHQLQEQREDLLRTVSHDLRTPLTSIIGQAQIMEKLLEKTGQNGNLKRSANAILTGGRRMNAMIQDLVDMARLESGQFKLDRVPIDLCDYLSDLKGRLSDALELICSPTILPGGFSFE
ncbi:MAG: PAS domain-containing sensor histidine kinase [Chloroflexota bacterium]